MSKYKTEQEDFWVGSFGDSYIGRNSSNWRLASRLALYSEIFSHTRNIKSILEFGANVGMNLRAIKSLLPEVELSAIEINSTAAAEIRKIGNIDLFEGSMLEYKPEKQFDLTLIKAVLIHINPDFLPQVYQNLYQASSRYILLAEYYNPTPTLVTYRGHENKLCKRDFAGEMLDIFDDLKLVSYGFRYHRDNNFPQDDINWFLLEKI